MHEAGGAVLDLRCRVGRYEMPSAGKSGRSVHALRQVPVLHRISKELRLGAGALPEFSRAVIQRSRMWGRKDAWRVQGIGKAPSSFSL